MPLTTDNNGSSATLTGTLVPPSISNTVAILESIMAAEQGVRNITVGYGQGGNMVQDVAALKALEEQTNHYLELFGYKDVFVSTVFHQWMGGFPENESEALALISYASTVAALGKEADKAISIQSIPDRKTLHAYGKSKLDSELVMQRYHAEGMPLWVVNPTVILGPPAWPDGSSSIPRSIAKGMPFATKGSTGWVDVRDVAGAICHLIDAKGLGKQVMLNGHNASFSKLFSVLATAMGKTPPRWLIPKWLLLRVAHIEATLDRLIGRKANLGIDGARAASAISLYDNQSALDQGLSFRSLEETAAFIAKTQKILQSA